MLRLKGLAQGDLSGKMYSQIQVCQSLIDSPQNKSVLLLEKIGYHDLTIPVFPCLFISFGVYINFFFVHLYLFMHL